MKKVIMLFLMLSAIHTLSGQTITIGTGTSNSLYGPIYIYSSSSTNTNSWNLTIYDQAEILAAGGFAADFTGISWNKTSTGAYLTPDATFQIYIKHTTLNEFPSAADFNVEVTGATLVYDNNTQTLPATIGWIDFSFDNNFTWNGTDNIMILTRWERVGNGTDAVDWESTSTTPLTRVSHSFNASSTMGTLYTTPNRPNIRLNLSSSTSIAGNPTLENFDAYPNPSSGFLSIRKPIDPCNLSISEITGRKVFECTMPAGNDYRLNLPQLADGIYLVRIASGNAERIKKIVIRNDGNQ